MESYELLIKPMDIVARRSLAVIVQLLHGITGRRQIELRRLSKKN